jgi:hypothetical protein
VASYSVLLSGYWDPYLVSHLGQFEKLDTVSSHAVLVRSSHEVKPYAYGVSYVLVLFSQSRV